MEFDAVVLAVVVLVELLSLEMSSSSEFRYDEADERGGLFPKKGGAWVPLEIAVGVVL